MTARCVPGAPLHLAANFPASRPFVKNQKRTGGDQRKPEPVIPPQRLLQIQNREAGEHDQRDHLPSCMVLSCAAEYTALPQRLAGTASQYSKNAMPQLTIIASGSGLCLNFRWPYHANVMNTLEANSIRTGKSCGEMVGISVLSRISGRQHPVRSLGSCSAQLN